MFNLVNYFRVSVEVMHDVWEGVAKKTGYALTDKLINVNDIWLMLDIVNSRIKSLLYDEVEVSNDLRLYNMKQNLVAKNLS